MTGRFCKQTRRDRVGIYQRRDRGIDRVERVTPSERHAKL